MKRRLGGSKGGAEGAPVHLAAIETVVFADLLNFVEHLAVTRYDDGTAREPGTAMLKVEGLTWKLSLTDPDTVQRMVIGGASLDDVFLLANTLLGDEKGPWEHDKYAALRKKGK